MIGRKVILTYQEKTDVADGHGGFDSTWRDIRNFNGNFMEALKEAGSEKFKLDKNQNKVDYIYIVDYSVRTIIKNNGRFYKKDIEQVFEVVSVDNVAFLNRQLEIRLRKIK